MCFGLSRCGSGSDPRQWEKATRAKGIVLAIWRNGPTGAKVVSMKGVQKIIQTQTKGTADPRVRLHSFENSLYLAEATSTNTATESRRRQSIDVSFSSPFHEGSAAGRGSQQARRRSLSASLYVEVGPTIQQVTCI